MRLVLYREKGNRDDLKILGHMLKPYVNSLMREGIVANNRLLETPQFAGFYISKNNSKYMKL